MRIFGLSATEHEITIALLVRLSKRPHTADLYGLRGVMNFPIFLPGSNAVNNGGVVWTRGRKSNSPRLRSGRVRAAAMRVPPKSSCRPSSFDRRLFFCAGQTRQNRQQQAVPGDTHTQHTQRGHRGRSHTFGHTVRKSHQRARTQRQKPGKILFVTKMTRVSFRRRAFRRWWRAFSERAVRIIRENFFTLRSRRTSFRS